MSEKKKDTGLPYESAPMSEPVFGQPESALELINKYGTYNIQPTADTENVFPLIAPGLPKKWREMVIEKQDLEDL